MQKKIRKTLFLPEWIEAILDSEGEKYDGPGVVAATAINGFSELDEEGKKARLKTFRAKEIDMAYQEKKNNTNQDISTIEFISNNLLDKKTSEIKEKGIQLKPYKGNRFFPKKIGDFSHWWIVCHPYKILKLLTIRTFEDRVFEVKGGYIYTSEIQFEGLQDTLNKYYPLKESKPKLIRKRNIVSYSFTRKDAPTKIVLDYIKTLTPTIEISIFHTKLRKRFDNEIIKKSTS